jgi:hypothetical protein
MDTPARRRAPERDQTEPSTIPFEFLRHVQESDPNTYLHHDCRDQKSLRDASCLPIKHHTHLPSDD